MKSIIFSKTFIIVIFHLIFQFGGNTLFAKTPTYSSWGWNKGSITDYYKNIKVIESGGNTSLSCADYNSFSNEFNNLKEIIISNAKKYCENDKLYPKNKYERIHLVDNFNLQITSNNNSICFAYTYNIVCAVLD